jgi:fructose-1,6-bisphosphatase II
MAKTKKSAVETKAAKAETVKKQTKAAAKVAVKNIDLERLIEMDLVRATEAAALNSYHWLGKGNADAAHESAVDAMRGAMDLASVSATVVFGDGLKPQAGGIQADERLGNWIEGAPKMDFASVPIDGLDLVARGYWGAMSVLVAACSENNQPALMKIPCRYMYKIAYGPAVKAGPAQLHLDASVRDNLEIVAMKLGKRLQDLSVAVLDRDRHSTLVNDIRKAGASARLIRDGDIAACIAPSFPNTGVDVYMGTGGAAEAVMAAAAIKCIGGDMLARVAPDAKEEKQIIEALGKDVLKKQFFAHDLALSKNIVFCATGISDGSILRGVHVDGASASTSSLVMRSRFGTIRKIKAIHDLSRKTIRLHSAGAESML